MKRYNSLNTLSLPEIVYLSTLWRKKKGKKKVLKNLQRFKKKKKKAPLPLFCNGRGCEIIRLKNTGGVLRVEFDWQDFLKAVNKPNSLRERNRGGRFHHKIGKTVSSWIIDTAQNTVVHFFFLNFSFCKLKQNVSIGSVHESHLHLLTKQLKEKKSAGRILTYRDNKQQPLAHRHRQIKEEQ